MKKRKLLIYVLAMSIILSIKVSAYAEESFETEQINSINQKENVEQTIDETLSYEIQDVLMETGEIQTERKLTVKVLMNTTEGIENAVLSGFATEKEADVQYECTSINDSEIIFEIIYEDKEKDDYTLYKVTIFSESDEISFDLSEYGDFSYTVYSTFEGDSLDEIMLFTTRNPMFTGVNGNDGRFVVVLDPGHDPACTDRAWVNGVWEPDLNWRMAESLKTELEKYEGVEVYINREWEECPGLVDVQDDFYCLERRVMRAAELDADLVISLHNNAAGNGSLQSSAHGSVIYITRYLERQAESKALAETVLEKLEAYGLKNNGIKTRYYGDDAKDKYPDGTGWDYYAITRHSTLLNIPSLLIEHAFMDNTIDLAFLRDEVKVAEIGRCDAQAIAEYYELELKGTKPEESEDPDEPEYATGDMTVLFSEEGYLYLDIKDVDASYEIKDVSVGVWSEINDKDDLIWYTANPYQSGWTVTVDLSDHKMDEGLYYIDLCFVDTKGQKRYVNTFTTEVDMPDSVIGEKKTEPMYRLYNPNSGEHFYTADVIERDHLDEIGWNYEGIGWYAPETGNPVYRLYNPNAGDHHYTLNVDERDHLVSVGWNYEGIGWYSDVKERVPLYRLYNPNAVAGAHHYTVAYNEAEHLKEVGWNYEGIGWYGVVNSN